jgi:hypothetical protein
MSTANRWNRPGSGYQPSLAATAIAPVTVGTEGPLLSKELLQQSGQPRDRVGDDGPTRKAEWLCLGRRLCGVIGMTWTSRVYSPIMASISKPPA